MVVVEKVQDNREQEDKDIRVAVMKIQKLRVQRIYWTNKLSW